MDPVTDVQDSTTVDSGTTTPPQQEPAPVETEPQQTTEPEPAPSDATTQTPQDEGPAPAGGRAQERIAQLTAKEKEARQQADYWKGVAEGRYPPPGGQQQFTPPPQAPIEPPSPPNPHDYEKYEDYAAANTTYVRDLAKWEAERVVQETIVNRTLQEKHNAFITRVQEAGKKDPDITAAMSDPTFLPNGSPAAGFIAGIIKESDIAPALIKHLYTNRAEVDRLYTLPPGRIAVELGKLEARLSATSPTPTPTVRTVSQAPEPTTTVVSGGPAGGEADLDNMPMSEFIKRRNEAGRRPAPRR